MLLPARAATLMRLWSAGRRAPGPGAVAMACYGVIEIDVDAS
jgi:hypothetical protein